MGWLFSGQVSVNPIKHELEREYFPDVYVRDLVHVWLCRGGGPVWPLGLRAGLRVQGGAGGGGSTHSRTNTLHMLV